jgi:hypothetical protein
VQLRAISPFILDINSHMGRIRDSVERYVHPMGIHCTTPSKETIQYQLTITNAKKALMEGGETANSWGQPVFYSSKPEEIGEIL